MFYHTLSLIKKFNPEVLPKLAETILLAQDIHEQSWNTTEQYYTVTNFGAAIQAAEQIGIDQYYEDIIGGFNQNYWNDIQSWATTELLRAN